MKRHGRALDWYHDDDQAHWREVVLALRLILLEAGLEETVKWGQPCYMDRGKNVALVGWMKGSAILSIFKGALLSDPDGHFQQAGSIRTARYLAFQTAAEVEALRPRIEAWLQEAVEATRVGKTLPPRSDALETIDELEDALAADEALREAWEALTPGRRRGFHIHFGKAKRAETRVARIARERHKIIAGKGFFECACGLSARMPKCDGSHKTQAS